MAAKRPIVDLMKQKQKAHYCPTCGGEAKLFKALHGGMRGRCEKRHEHPKAALILR